MSSSMAEVSDIERHRASSASDAVSPHKRARADLTPTEQNTALSSEIRELKAQLEAQEAQLAYFHRNPDGFLGPPRHAVKISRLPSGVQVRITGDELAAMRAIFALFDKESSGRVSAADLQDLHRKLGEPITDEEAKEAISIIGRGGDHITFDVRGDGGRGGNRHVTPRCAGVRFRPHRDRCTWLYFKSCSFALYWDGAHPSQRSLDTATAESPVGVPAATGFTTLPPMMSPTLRAVSASGDSKDLERARKRQWYQQRFKFLKCKVANPAVGRIYAVPQGPCPSLEYRVRFFYDDEETGAAVQVSPWHDVPCRNPDRTYNMIVEIPKWSRRKYEIATGEPFNPIKQDVKNGKLREYGWGDMLFNYGAIPQTYESPGTIHPDTGKIGDNDPIDVVDIGTKMWTTGSIVRVKVLGVLGMIDAGETDWKLIGINAEDPLAALLHDVDDIRVHMPGSIEALHRWLKFYKSPSINDFAYGGEPRGRAFAEALVEETHEAWQR